MFKQSPGWVTVTRKRFLFLDSDVNVIPDSRLYILVDGSLVFHLRVIHKQFAIYLPIRDLL